MLLDPRVSKHWIRTHSKPTGKGIAGTVHRVVFTGEGEIWDQKEVRGLLNLARDVHLTHLDKYILSIWDGKATIWVVIASVTGRDAQLALLDQSLRQRCTEIATGLNVPWKYKALKVLLIEILIKIRKPIRRNISVAPPWATNSMHIWGHGTLHFANAGYEDVLLLFFSQFPLTITKTFY